MKHLLLILTVFFLVACSNKKNPNENIKSDIIIDSITEYLTDTTCCNNVKEDCTLTKSKCCVSDSSIIEKERKEFSKSIE